jgi:hypothetical protein
LIELIVLTISKKKISPLLLLLLLAIGFSCEEVIDPDLISGPPIIVIDGWLLPNAEETRVALSRSAPFNSNESNPRIEDALVIIREQFGQSNLFRETKDGFYQPINTSFTTRNFGRYNLEIQIDGVNYSSSITVKNTPTIDSLTYRFVEDNPLMEDGYYVTYHYQEPTTINDFYFWEVWRNGILISKQDVNISNDENTNGSYIDLELNYVFSKNDFIEVRLHSFTKEAYEYYQALKLLTESGSPAQAVPENPKSNLSSDKESGEIILGFFNATLPNSDTIRIVE